ncbi:hypothetical protein PBI_SCTP2_445 [Salicola phage SCTP-2]|nr:hypothetical protein PBI_SCTP2_445 [Salicola phage SCTP-2]
MSIENPPEEKIITNCSKYLKLLEYMHSQGIKKPLLRGDSNAYTELTKRNVDTRKPSLTPENIFNITDKWFEDNFGVRARSQSIFATTSTQQASEYGHIHYIFPIKKFNIIHSNKIDDLYAHLGERAISEKINSLYGNINVPKKYKNIAQYYEENYPKYFENAIRAMLDTFEYKKNDYANAFNSGNEIMIITKTFYIVEKQQWVNEFFEEFIYGRDIYGV